MPQTITIPLPQGTLFDLGPPPKKQRKPKPPRAQLEHPRICCGTCPKGACRAIPW